MALTEEIATTGTWLDDGQIQVKRTTYIIENGSRVAERPPYRHVAAPGDDVSGEDSRVQAVAAVLWTPAVIQAFRERRLRDSQPVS